MSEVSRSWLPHRQSLPFHAMQLRRPEMIKKCNNKAPLLKDIHDENHTTYSTGLRPLPAQLPAVLRLR